jgi:hypothetical protein
MIQYPELIEGKNPYAVILGRHGDRKAGKLGQQNKQQSNGLRLPRKLLLNGGRGKFYKAFLK